MIVALPVIVLTTAAVISTGHIQTSGITDGGIVCPRLPFRHSRGFPDNKRRGQVLAGIQCLSLLSFHSCALHGLSNSLKSLMT